MQDPESTGPTAARDAEGRVTVTVTTRTIRATEIAEASARWLGAIGLPTRAVRIDGGVRWSVAAPVDEADPWPDALSRVAAELVRHGDQGFVALGRWNAMVRDATSLLAWAGDHPLDRAPDPNETQPLPDATTTQRQRPVPEPDTAPLETGPAAFEAIGVSVATPGASDTAEAAPDASEASSNDGSTSGAAASPFQPIGAPEIPMPDADAEGRFTVRLETFGADAERTIALLARVLRTTPEALAPDLDVLPATIAIDQSARDVRRVLHATIATGATFSWEHQG